MTASLRKTVMAVAVAALLANLAACGKKEAAATVAESTKAAEAAAPSDTVTLKPGAETTAGIQLETITPQTLSLTVSAPGEVKSNDYRSVQITPRVAAQVVRRLAKLGDTVKVGQPLVTLTSVEVAEAQGEAQVKAREWARVRELGEAIVGGRRFLEARVAAEQARAKLIAYGLSAAEAGKSESLGQFTLVSTRAGTVLKDDFIEGERIEPGRVLFLIADEATVWIEANLSPADAAKVAEGSKARVKLDSRWLDGKVIQKHHLINETTRTIPVRIEVSAAGDHLHNGEFVECRVEIGSLDQVMAVPNTALYQGTDGSWAVFVQKSATAYQRVQVTLKDDLGEQTVVEGLEAGAKVVAQGAFYLNSELSKGSLGDKD